KNLFIMKKHFKGFVAKVELLKSQRATEDINGLMPVILLGIGGEMPSRNVISGTVAESMNLAVYLFNAKEQDSEPVYGRRFRFMTLSQELGPVDTLQACQFVGDLKLVDVRPPIVPDEHFDEVLTEK